MGENKKFEDVIEADDWEIMTPKGWSNINKIMKTIPYNKWVVEFEDGLYLEGADNHIVIDVNNEEVFIKDLKPEMLVRSINTTSKVKSVNKTMECENMYDVEVASSDHQYYSSGIVSHNTTTSAVYLLHEAIFNKDKSIAVLANKGNTANEILGRICKMFEELPWFLKPGVVTWNKTSIELANGSKIFGAATSSSSIRGKSANLILLDEFAHIQNDVEFYESTYPVISSGKTTKVIITSTPKGMNLFYKIWVDSEEGRNEFVRSKFLWYDHPERDDHWKKTTLGNIGESNWNQEYESCTGDTLVTVNDTTISLSELYQQLNNFTLDSESCIINEWLIFDTAIKLACFKYINIVIIVDKVRNGYSVIDQIYNCYQEIVEGLNPNSKIVKHIKGTLVSNLGVAIFIEPITRGDNFLRGRTINGALIQPDIIDKVVLAQSSKNSIIVSLKGK